MSQFRWCLMGAASFCGVLVLQLCLSKAFKLAEAFPPPPPAAQPQADQSSDGLMLRGITAAYGRLGPARSDLRVVAFDQVYFRYEVAGLQSSPEGDATLTTIVSVTDAAGKGDPVQPVVVRVPLVLGGDSLPGFATVAFTDKQRPGKYRVRVRVLDAAGRAAEFTRELELLPPRLSIASLNFTHDAAGELDAPAGGVVGSSIFVRFLVVGFTSRDGAGRPRIDVEVTGRLLDANGQPCHEAAALMTQRLATDNPTEIKQATNLTVVNALLLHRVGSFDLELTVVDKLSGRRVQHKVPLGVTAVENSGPADAARGVPGNP